MVNGELTCPSAENLKIIADPEGTRKKMETLRNELDDASLMIVQLNTQWRMVCRERDTLQSKLDETNEQRSSAVIAGMILSVLSTLVMVGMAALLFSWLGG